MILVAPTAFKGSVSAGAAAHAMAAGARAVTSLPVRAQPLSDGGPGLIDALSVFEDAVLDRVRVSGPHGDPVDARILIWNRKAILESADACGWHLVRDDQRDVTRLNTFGVGELIVAAGDYNVDEIIVGLGGSATIDAGLGMKQALQGNVLPVPVRALADVQIPLMQAAPIFGPQKGASPIQIEAIQQKFAALITETGVGDFPRAGAAGGLGYGLRVFANAEIMDGSDWVLDATGVRDDVAKSTLVITGEGQFDAQSFMGKICGKLIQLAKNAKVPILVVTGKDAKEGDGYARVVDNGGARLTEADMEGLVKEQLPALLPH